VDRPATISVKRASVKEWARIPADIAGGGEVAIFGIARTGALRRKELEQGPPALHRAEDVKINERASQEERIVRRVRFISFVMAAVFALVIGLTTQAQSTFASAAPNQCTPGANCVAVNCQTANNNVAYTAGTGLNIATVGCPYGHNNVAVATGSGVAQANACGNSKVAMANSVGPGSVSSATFCYATNGTNTGTVAVAGPGGNAQAVTANLENNNLQGIVLTSATAGVTSLGAVASVTSNPYYTADSPSNDCTGLAAANPALVAGSSYSFVVAAAGGTEVCVNGHLIFIP